MTWWGILENIVGSVLYTAILVVVGLCIVRITQRVRLLRFFGARDGRRIVIYLSNLRVIEGGAVGIDGRRRSYQGSAVPFLEMLVAGRLRDLFNHPIPSLADGPSFVERLLISDVEVDLIHSPLSIEDVERSSPFISLGSPAYSSASALIEARLDSQITIHLGRRPGRVAPSVSPPPGDTPAQRRRWGSTEVTSSASATGSAVEWMSSATMGTASTIDIGSAGAALANADEASLRVRGVPGLLADPALGFLERVVERQDAGTRFAFYVGGISEVATAGAAHFLAARWRQLERKYHGNAPFLVVLRIESDDYRRWSIVFERSGAGTG